MTETESKLGTQNSERGTNLHRLIVFSDDWGRHPSSCQHLIGQLLPRYQTLWVNTIGTRSPKLSMEDLGKVFKKIGQWLSPPAKEAKASVTIAGDRGQGTGDGKQGTGDGGQGAGDRQENLSPSTGESRALKNLTVVSPKMFPGFRKSWQRKLNRKLIVRAIHKALGPRQPGEIRTAITTIPITADLPRTDANDHGGLDVDRWVYYCVDDFSVWPGLDGSVLDAMDKQMAQRADAIVAVSQTLRDRIAAWGCPSTLLTHGIDLKHWSKAGDRGRETGDRERERGDKNVVPAKLTHFRAWDASAARPIYLFWGVVDQRLDVDWCLTIAEKLGMLVLMGPQQSPSAKLLNHPRIIMPGPMPYESLPALAAEADVLVMPYADLPVTRAIQPLKFKEYLATGKPVIARLLPATLEWADAADVLESIEDVLKIAPLRIEEGIPALQVVARERLMHESWQAKAAVLEQVILGFESLR